MQEVRTADPLGCKWVNSRSGNPGNRAVFDSRFLQPVRTKLLDTEKSYPYA